MSAIQPCGRPWRCRRTPALLADGDAVADRLAFRQHVIEIARVGIDHDRAGRFLAVIGDDVPAIGLGDGRLGVGRVGQQFLVARSHALPEAGSGVEDDVTQPPRLNPTSRSATARIAIIFPVNFRIEPKTRPDQGNRREKP